MHEEESTRTPPLLIQQARYNFHLSRERMEVVRQVYENVGGLRTGSPPQTLPRQPGCHTAESVALDQRGLRHGLTQGGNQRAQGR